MAGVVSGGSLYCLKQEKDLAKTVNVQCLSNMFLRRVSSIERRVCCTQYKKKNEMLTPILRFPQADLSSPLSTLLSVLSSPYCPIQSGGPSSGIFDETCNERILLPAFSSFTKL